MQQLLSARPKPSTLSTFRPRKCRRSVCVEAVIEARWYANLEGLGIPESKCKYDGCQDGSSALMAERQETGAPGYEGGIG
eukprot:489736-Rhodomonas_salina.3